MGLFCLCQMLLSPGVTDMSTGQSGSGNRFAILNAAAEEVDC